MEIILCVILEERHIAFRFHRRTKASQVHPNCIAERNGIYTVYACDWERVRPLPWILRDAYYVRVGGITNPVRHKAGRKTDTLVSLAANWSR